MLSSSRPTKKKTRTQLVKLTRRHTLGVSADTDSIVHPGDGRSPTWPLRSEHAKCSFPHSKGSFAWQCALLAAFVSQQHSNRESCCIRSSSVRRSVAVDSGSGRSWTASISSRVHSSTRLSSQYGSPLAQHMCHRTVEARARGACDHTRDGCRPPATTRQHGVPLASALWRRHSQQ